MAPIKIAEEFCKECGLCVEACPKKILEISDRLNTKGYKIVQVTDMDGCISCGACAKVCPDVVISVYKD